MSKLENYFEIKHIDRETRARVGVLKLPHGEVTTPFYMPVATKGAVKTLMPSEVSQIGYEIILSNTYHLIEKPGLEEIASFGGLHSYIGWQKPILTDSGGYQVFSLHKMVKVESEGVLFKSLIDGRNIKATPEAVLDWQKILNSDISMVLDVCTPYGIDKNRATEALEITEQWAKRSLKHWKKYENEERLLFGIVQGNFFADLRKRAAENLSEMDFDGYAAGGLSVGEPKELMFEMSEIVVSNLPENKPRYLMGLGDLPSILKAIAQGYDLFDSALNTRISRGGAFYTRKGLQNIRLSKFKGSKEPFEPLCKCFVCNSFTIGFIRHLYLSEETLALRLLTYHNLYFINEVLKEARQAIIEKRYKSFLENFLAQYSEKDCKNV